MPQGCAGIVAAHAFHACPTTWGPRNNGCHARLGMMLMAPEGPRWWCAAAQERHVTELADLPHMDN